MKWSTVQLQKYRDKGIAIDEHIHIANEMKALNPEILDVSPLHVKGRGDVSADSVSFHLTIEGTLVLPCSRTLVDVNVPVHVETRETFLLKTSMFDEDMIDRQEELHEVKGETVDLLPIIREILLLEIPMQVFSEEAKRSDSLPSGQDWEVMTEEERETALEEEEPKVDPRLAGLAGLFNKDNE
ncbi:YceD family protein [Mangrovibacillus cuniculi]|uniref:DUF177 domain-containing protein n=1 Tax=Mangrovibacillus cuniculi TaxID=2593652 RepID=A0A7S8HEY0_9BACI|nr:DUF177 domain-containing protein [Mangrovibacillus cuniculi]QPC46238.1 DUF177 domain-containing protein [Mangrovibacillus cuniculi]